MKFDVALKSTAAAAVIALGMSVGAEAATIANIGNGGSVNAAMSTVVEGGVLTAQGPGGYTIENSSLGGQYRSPFEGTANMGADYFNVLGGNIATFTANAVKDTLTFLWGSPDGYNKVELFLGAVSQGSFSLADIPPSTTPGLNANLVKIYNVSYDSAVFTSGQNSFELSNISSVPLPAGAVLLVGALGGLGALRRRKKAA